MKARSVISDLVILRPLLHVRGHMLRDWLTARGQIWREDASNASQDYLRNRIRLLFASRPNIAEAMLQLGEACAALRDWLAGNAPTLDAGFESSLLANLPDLLQRESAARWLIARGVPPESLSPDVVARLILMAIDAATGPRQHFPGGVLVHRRRGTVFASNT